MTQEITYVDNRTHRERLRDLLDECWSDTKIPTDVSPVALAETGLAGPLLICRATLAAALFRARWILEMGDERLLGAVRSDVLADAIVRREQEDMIREET